MNNEHSEQFVQLLTSNYRKIYAYIYALVPNRADADDLMQEVSTFLFRRFDEYQPGTNFTAWAKKVAMYTILNFRKKQKKDSGLSFSADTIQLISDRMDTQSDLLEERISALRTCIQKLDARDKQLLVIRYEQGVTVKKLASLLNTSLATLYRSLERVHHVLMYCIRKATTSE